MDTHSLAEHDSIPAEADTRVRTLLILGASGDLTGRLLLPGLARLIRMRRGDGLTLVGAGSDDWTDAHWRERIDGATGD